MENDTSKRRHNYNMVIPCICKKLDFIMNAKKEDPIEITRLSNKTSTPANAMGKK